MSTSQQGSCSISPTDPSQSAASRDHDPAGHLRCSSDDTDTSTAYRSTLGGCKETSRRDITNPSLDARCQGSCQPFEFMDGYCTVETNYSPALTPAAPKPSPVRTAPDTLIGAATMTAPVVPTTAHVAVIELDAVQVAACISCQPLRKGIGGTALTE